jgi:hypothetical protein
VCPRAWLHWLAACVIITKSSPNVQANQKLGVNGYETLGVWLREGTAGPPKRTSAGGSLQPAMSTQRGACWKRTGLTQNNARKRSAARALSLCGSKCPNDTHLRSSPPQSLPAGSCSWPGSSSASPSQSPGNAHLLSAGHGPRA